MVKVVRGVLGSVFGTNGISDLGEVDVLPGNEDVSRTSVLESLAAGARGVLVLARGVNLDAQGLSERAGGVKRTLGAVVLRGACIVGTLFQRLSFKWKATYCRGGESGP